MNSQEFFTKMEQYIQQELQSGCDYNILLALYKDSNEMNLHSRFIYSLLNPNGYHYKGDSFLKEFLKICGCDFTFDMKKIEVLLEYSTTEYRRVDLVIKDGTKCVIIENKVNAKDSKKQLVDYIKHFCRKEKYKRENIYAIYLSPDGRYPSKASIGNYRIEDGYLAYGQSKVYVEVKFKSISYQKEIKEWIKSCEKYCSSDMKLILNQYLSVLKSLNGELEYQRDKLEYEYIKEQYTKAEALYRSGLEEEEEQRIENVAINIISEFMDEVAKEFEKQKTEDELKADNCFNDSLGWMSIYNPKWIPNDEDEIILFWVFREKDKLYIKIAENGNLYEKYKGAKWGRRIEKAFKPYKRECLDFGECDLLDKTKIAKAIIEGRVKADEIAKQINGFVSKYKDRFIEINENAKEKTHEFWKNLPKP